MELLQKTLVVVSLVFSINLFATAESVNSIALFNLRPVSMDAIGADADLLYSLEVEFEKSSQLSVMSRRDIEAVLHRIGGAQVSDTNLVIVYGQEMGVGFILTGDVDKTGSSMKVNLNLVDIVGGRVVKVWQENYTGRGDVLQGSKSLAEEIKQSIQLFAQFMTGGVAAGTVYGLLFGLFMARWWQSALYNPGGFRAEFLSLKVHPPMAIASIFIVA